MAGYWSVEGGVYGSVVVGTDGRVEVRIYGRAKGNWGVDSQLKWNLRWGLQ